MIHTKGNYSFAKKIEHLKTGDMITGGNYSQLSPNMDIFAGIENVTVTAGLFINCRKPASWTIKGGNWKQVERCSHVHPDWVGDWGLPVCKVNCKHCLGKDKQWVLTDEAEFRDELNSTLPTKKEVRVTDATDGDGIVTQTFEKLEYVYRDTRL